MKRLLLSLAMLLTIAPSLLAQNRFAQNGPRDNWYVGANVGFDSKLTHNTFMTHLNPEFTVRFGRDILPIVGVMAEVTTFFNDQGFPGGKLPGQDRFSVYSHTFVKAFDLNLLGSLNLHNLFQGYPGYQRFFETRFLAGVGMNHVCGIDTKPKNDFIAKFGFDFAFNLDRYFRMKGWEAYVEPAMNFNLNRYSEHVEFNPNCAAWQLAVGFNYHFGRDQKAPKQKAVATPSPSTAPAVKVTKTITIRKHEQPATVEQPVKVEQPITVEQPVKVEESAKVEPVKEKKAAPAKEKKAAPAKPATKKQASTATPAAVNDNAALPAIRFNVGENVIPDNQYDALSKVASYMKNHPRAHIVIKGQSARTAAVKNALVRRFGINATRLSTASGAQGDSVTFAEK